MSEILERLKARRESLRSELNRVETAIDVIEEEERTSIVSTQIALPASTFTRGFFASEGKGRFEFTPITIPANNGYGLGSVMPSIAEEETEEAEEEEVAGTTEIVLDYVAQNATKGVRSADIISAVKAERPNERDKYIYTVLNRQVNKTKRLRKDKKRYFPA